MQSGLVKNLAPRGSQWNVTVRVARVWENRDATQTVYELAFVFIDEQGNMIEGCLPANRFDKFRGTLEEGTIYNIVSFMLADPRKSYRAVDNPHRIRLTQNTRVTIVNPQPEDFPFYAYDAKPFDELEQRTGDNTILSDVIGVVHRLTGILPPKTTGDPRRQIFLKNENGANATVTLWGNYAQAFDAESLSEGSIEENMIVLFVGMTVTKFSGQLAFKSTASTQWYFNPEIPEVDALRQSLGTRRYIIEWEGLGAATIDPPDTTLYALSNKDVDEIVRKKFKLNIVITEVNNPTDWWYYSCQDCWTKMTLVGNIRRCPRCRQAKDQQRYRISVKAEDIEPNPENKTVVGQFVFFGDNGKVLTEKDAILLAAQTRGRPEFVPAAISNIVGKKCTVTAEVKQDTLDADDGLIIFSVSRADLIGSSIEEAASSSRSIQLVNSQAAGLSAAIETDKTNFLETTPIKDVIEAATTSTKEQATESASESKKRKGSTSGNKGAKKSTSELFSAK